MSGESGDPVATAVGRGYSPAKENATHPRKLCHLSLCLATHPACPRPHPLLNIPCTLTCSLPLLSHPPPLCVTLLLHPTSPSSSPPLPHPLSLLPLPTPTVQPMVASTALVSASGIKLAAHTSVPLQEMCVNSCVKETHPPAAIATGQHPA